jgi:hypothetical protein
MGERMRGFRGLEVSKVNQGPLMALIFTDDIKVE